VSLLDASKLLNNGNDFNKIYKFVSWGSGGQSWGVRAKIVGDADKAYVRVVEVDSKSDPFCLLQYNIN
jgi:hypothetical protein